MSGVGGFFVSFIELWRRILSGVPRHKKSVTSAQQKKRPFSESRSPVVKWKDVEQQHA